MKNKIDEYVKQVQEQNEEKWIEQDMDKRVEQYLQTLREIRDDLKEQVNERTADNKIPSKDRRLLNLYVGLKVTINQVETKGDWTE